MLAFLSMALFIYGAMHLYALAKVWQAFPHSLALGLALVFGGLLMTLSPLLAWFIEKQNWHNTTAFASWVIYSWMGFLFLFFRSHWHSTSFMRWRYSRVSNGH